MCSDLINVVLLERSTQSLNYVYSCDLNVLYRCPGKMAINSLQLLEACMCMYDHTSARVWINRVRLPNLRVVS